MPVKRERTRENARVVLMIEVEQEEKGVQKMKRRGQERQYKRQDKLRGKEYDSSWTEEKWVQRIWVDMF